MFCLRNLLETLLEISLVSKQVNIVFASCRYSLFGTAGTTCSMYGETWISPQSTYLLYFMSHTELSAGQIRFHQDLELQTESFIWQPGPAEMQRLAGYHIKTQIQVEAEVNPSFSFMMTRFFLNDFGLFWFTIQALKKCCNRFANIKVLFYILNPAHVVRVTSGVSQ